MKTPKEKAKELARQMCLLNFSDENIVIAKQCALICVDEIIKGMHRQIKEVDHIDIIYWEEVKQEIKKL